MVGGLSFSLAAGHLFWGSTGDHNRRPQTGQGRALRFLGTQTERVSTPHRSAVFTKSALYCRSRAGSWAGSGDEGAGETKALGAGLCLGLVSDTLRSSQKGHPSLNPTSPRALQTLCVCGGWGRLRLRQAQGYTLQRDAFWTSAIPDCPGSKQ